MTRKRFLKLLMAQKGFDRNIANNRVKHFQQTRKMCEVFYAHRSNLSVLKPRQPHLLTYQRYYDEYEKPESVAKQ